MERYKNIAGDSPVAGFEIGADFIVVQFKTGMKYRYSYAATGHFEVEKLKSLASEGKGLATYLRENRDVSRRFESKFF